MEKLRLARLRLLARVAVDEGTRLVGLALVAVGVSGLLAWGMGATAGKGFVAGDPPGVTYTKARCADFFEYAPHARSCEQAATEHHFLEVVDSRMAAGVLGIVALAFAAWWRRRHPPSNVLPGTLVPTAAAAVTATVGVWLCGQGLDLVVQRTDGGGGGYLSAGIVALALACWFARPIAAAVVDGLPAAPSPA